MWAAGYGQLGSARQLLKAGANKNYRGLNGETPLHLAAAYGHHDRSCKVIIKSWRRFECK